MALIELSPETPAPPAAAAAAPPAYYYRRAGLILALLLLLLPGGAAPVTSLLWQRVGAVPVPVAADFQMLGGTLYVMDLEAEPRVLTAWQAQPLRRLWSFTAGTTDDPFYVYDTTADFTLVRSGRSTTVLDARTGAVRWTAPVSVQPVNDQVAFVEEEIFRPGTEYDAESGDPGQLYGTNSGALHTEPAQRTELRGVELGTGTRRWSRSFPGSVFTARSGGVVVVLTSAKLVLLSPTTGAVLRERPVPVIDGLRAEEGEVVGDTVLVHYGAFDTGGLVTAYSRDTLDELWRQDQPDPAGNSAYCSGLPCVRSSAELIMLDPRTGAERWRIAGTDVIAFGPDTVLETRGTTTPVRIADARTGRPRIDLDRWRFYFPVQAGDAYLFSRLESDRTTVFGLLRQGAAAIQPLGRLPEPAAQCQAVPGLLACRAAAGVEVWAYHA